MWKSCRASFKSKTDPCFSELIARVRDEASYCFHIFTTSFTSCIFQGIYRFFEAKLSSPPSRPSPDSRGYGCTSVFSSLSSSGFQCTDNGSNLFGGPVVGVNPDWSRAIYPEITSVSFESGAVKSNPLFSCVRFWSTSIFFSGFWVRKEISCFKEKQDIDP